jgi:hypothetical protein
VCVCVCVCKYRYIHIFMHTYINTYMHTLCTFPPHAVNASWVCVLFKILLRERGHPRVPPCNVLNMSFLFFLKQSLRGFASCLNFGSCICMYIRIYLHTCYVLIRPPIPYITSSRCKRLHKFHPKKFLLHKRTNTRVPPCNDLND